MEISVTKENLDFALTNVSRVASTKTGLPILNNILLRTDSNRLLVAATNLEIASSHYIGAKVTKPGSITIPAKLVSDFVHNLPKEQITLTVKNNRLHLTASQSSSIINGVADDDFPELPTIESKKAVSYTLTTNDFKESVSQTIIAASSDTTRPVLTGVYWHSFEGSLYMAATDGYRLTERKVVKTNSQVDAIIPTNTLQEVLRTLRDDIDELEVLFDDTQVTFRFGEVEITSRLIDGTFPDYRQLIPKTSTTSFTLARDEFTRTIKIASLFARESGGGITLTLDTDKKTLSVHSIASEVGENTSEIPVTLTGEAGAVSLNSRYLADALSVIDGSDITFEFSGKLAPCIVHDSTKSPEYKHIIMPLKS